MKIKVKVAKRDSRVVKIKTEYIRLCDLLKFASVAMTGGESKIYITEGLVRVNGEVCTAKGKKIYPGDVVTFENDELIIAGAENEE